MNKFGVAMCVLFLTACGGGNDTSSKGGSETSLGSTQAPTGTSGSSGIASTPGGSGPDGTYQGQITATLSGDGILPVTDSTAIVIVISGPSATLTAEGRSYKGSVSGDSFVVNVPINESTQGITCSGTPVLKGTISGNTVSGTVSGTGSCSSATTNVPVSVEGKFSAGK